MAGFTQGNFSEAQAITSSAVASTNYIKTKGDGLYADIFLDVSVNTAFADGTSVKIDLQTDDNTSFSSPKTLMSVNVALANLTQYSRLFLGQLPTGVESYIRLYYTPTGTFTAGKLDAKLTYGTNYQTK